MASPTPWMRPRSQERAEVPAVQGDLARFALRSERLGGLAVEEEHDVARVADADRERRIDGVLEDRAALLEPVVRHGLTVAAHLHPGFLVEDELRDGHLGAG